MAITNPIAIKFVNEQIRPLAEQVRALVSEINSCQTDWFGGTNAMFPNDTSAVDDKRDAEGIPRLTGADVNSVMNVLIAMSGASNAQIVAKPCVRPLKVG